MPLDEDDAEAGQRLAAPADRRPAAVRTIDDLDRRRRAVPASARTRPRPARRWRACSATSGCQTRRAAAIPRSRSGAAPPRDRRTLDDRRRRRRALTDRLGVRTPSHQTISARWSNDGSRSRSNEIVVEAREAFRWIRRLELALIAELHGRAERADVVLDRLLHLVGREQPAVLLDHPRRRVDLRVLDAGREPDAADRQAALRRRLDQRRPRLA